MMNNCTTKIAEEVINYCALIGQNPLLVQGAGGNVSWKNADVLWIKASGKWLANADKEIIFTPIDLAHFRAEISKGNFFAKPVKKDDSDLRPSIETALHALMPHKIVVHLHPVEILAHLVRSSPQEVLKEILGDSISWAFVNYFQPGPALAEATSVQLLLNPGADVVFMKNHGVIIGAENIADINKTLNKLTSLLKNEIVLPTLEQDKVIRNLNNSSSRYVISNDKEINRLAIDIRLSKRLEHDWVLYPDHAVFLGNKACVIYDEKELEFYEKSKVAPPFIFFIGHGVLENKLSTEAHKIQLLCYYNVLIRQAISEKLIALEENQVRALLNWDAEKYRQMIAPK